MQNYYVGQQIDSYRITERLGMGGMAVVKLDEIPYDFIRKRLSMVVSENGAHTLITKSSL